jgi:hypothetical protein
MALPSGSVGGMSRSLVQIYVYIYIYIYIYMSGAPLRVALPCPALPCPDRLGYLLSAAGRAARSVVLYTRSACGLGYLGVWDCGGVL